MLRAVLQKEFRLLARDRGTVLRLFALPVLFIVVFGSVFHFGPADDLATRPTVALCTAPADRRWPPWLAGPRNDVTFRPLPTAEAVRAAVAADDVAAGLIIPLLPGKPAAVRVPLHGAMTALLTRARAGGADVRIVEVRARPGVVAPPPTASPSGFPVAVPRNAVRFGFFISLTVALAFAQERRSGAWRRALAAAVHRRTLRVGKLVLYVLLGLGQQAFLFGISVLLFGMHIAGSPLALRVLALVVALCAVALGLAIASLGGSEKQIGSAGSMPILFMGLLGGCKLPRLIMPAFMQRVGPAVPHG